MMFKIRNWFKHHTNSLHIYCRMVDMGFNPRFSRKLIEIAQKILGKF